MQEQVQKQKGILDQESEEAKEVKLEQAEEVEGRGEREEQKLEDLTRQELIEKPDEKSKEATSNYDKWLRASAELENYKKRVEKEKSEFFKYAQESLIKALLPIIDDLERAIEHAKDKENLKALVEGIGIVLKNFHDCLGKFGVTPIKAIGEKFDPNLHEAVMVNEDPEKSENTVVSELQRGYMLHGRVIRPAMVVVSKQATQIKPEVEEGIKD